MGEETATPFAIQTQQQIGYASGCHSGTHQVVVVGCAVERGAVTSELSGVTSGVDGADTGESVQGSLIHCGHSEEVGTEQGKGREGCRFPAQLIHT